jgi:hypothetical protein
VLNNIKKVAEANNNDSQKLAKNLQLESFRFYGRLLTLSNTFIGKVTAEKLS